MDPRVEEEQKQKEQDQDQITSQPRSLRPPPPTHPVLLAATT